jgi:hypothetical protein
MEPPYQRRGGIWGERDKAFLIDSIINGYDIPKFYLADFSSIESRLNVSERPFAVIDGKQRFEAIFQFLEGQLVLNDDFAVVDDPGLALGGLSYHALTRDFPEITRRVNEYVINVVGVVTDDEARIRQLFVRLNRSKPLTGAETRNAMEGIVPELIRELAAHDFFATKISFSTLRGGDLNTAAKLLLVEFRGQLVDTKKGPLDRFVKSAAQASREMVSDALISEAPLQDFHEAADRVRDVLDRMTRVFRDRDPLLRTQGPVTVYYWFVREVSSEHLDAVRQFLDEFTAARRNQRKLMQRGELVHPDQELIQYDLWDRSTNDQISLEGRFVILANRFERWLAARPEVALVEHVAG